MFLNGCNSASIFGSKGPVGDLIVPFNVESMLVWNSLILLVAWSMPENLQ
jgi:hypothetical protein